MPASHTFLLDNGSLAPEATLGLRRLAADLAMRIGEQVAPVSLLHASAVPAEQLDGAPAEIFEPAVSRRCEAGQRSFVVVPLFFGPSRALTDYLPERIAHLRKKWPELQIRVAPAVRQPGDDRLARILADQVRAVSPAPDRVALVDHGSPVREVTAVRDALARELAGLLGVAVAPCSMERRPEPEYDFNAPLLADLLNQPGWNSGEVVVALQFFLPGRHAGPAGDVARICREAEARHPGLRIRLTALLAGHPALVEILADRWKAGLESGKRG